jgi:hypothetical protein
VWQFGARSPEEAAKWIQAFKDAADHVLLIILIRLPKVTKLLQAQFSRIKVPLLSLEKSGKSSL